MSAKKEQQQLIPLQEKYRDLKKEVENKEIEVRATKNLGMCQSIFDEMRLCVCKVITNLQYVEKELELHGFFFKRKSTKTTVIQKEVQIATKEF